MSFSEDDINKEAKSILQVIEQMVNHPTKYYAIYPRFKELIRDVANAYWIEFMSEQTQEGIDPSSSEHIPPMKVIVEYITDYEWYKGRKVKLDAIRAQTLERTYPKDGLEGKSKKEIETYVKKNMNIIGPALAKLRNINTIKKDCGGYLVLCPYNK